MYRRGVGGIENHETASQEFIIRRWAARGGGSKFASGNNMWEGIVRKAIKYGMRGSQKGKVFQCGGNPEG